MKMKEIKINLSFSEILDICQNKGPITALNHISSQKRILDEMFHLIKVIEFCSVLKLILKGLLHDDKIVYLQLYVESDEIHNSSMISIKHKILTADKTEMQKIPGWTQTPAEYSIFQLFIKFLDNIDKDFINENLIIQPFVIQLKDSNIEKIKEALLNKHLYSIYQADFLNRILDTKEHKEKNTKI